MASVGNSVTFPDSPMAPIACALLTRARAARALGQSRISNGSEDTQQSVGTEYTGVH